MHLTLNIMLFAFKEVSNQQFIELSFARMTSWHVLIYSRMLRKIVDLLFLSFKICKVGNASCHFTFTEIKQTERVNGLKITNFLNRIFYWNMSKMGHRYFKLEVKSYKTNFKMTYNFRPVKITVNNIINLKYLLCDPFK